MWVTQSHIALPFRPVAEDKATSSPKEVWEAETQIFRSSYSCIPMRNQAQETVNFTYSMDITDTRPDDVTNHPSPRNLTGKAEIQRLHLISNNGCSIKIDELLPREDLFGGYLPGGYRNWDGFLADRGGPLWTNLSASHVSWSQFTAKRGALIKNNEWSPMDDRVMVDFSEGCVGRDLLLVTSPWRIIGELDYYGNKPPKIWPDFAVRAELCTSEHYEATLPVTVSPSNDPSVIFDQTEFQKPQQVVQGEILNLELLDRLFFQGNKPQSISRSKFKKLGTRREGMEEILAAAYSSNTTSMITDATFIAKAVALRQRFFGELIYSSLMSQETPDLENVRGQKASIAQRIAVVTPVASTMAALLLCTAVFMSYMV
jgi:hypothetical protein